MKHFVPNLDRCCTRKHGLTLLNQLPQNQFAPALRVASMAYGVCLIAAGLPADSNLDELIRLTGLEVWTPDSAGAGDGHIYGGALCLVIDMPREAGFRTFRLFRDHGVETPVLLIVDPGLEAAMTGLDPEWGLEVMARGADPREILARVAELCRIRRHSSEPARLQA